MGCDIHKETAHSSFGRVSWRLRSSRIPVLCCILQTSWGGETERYLHCLNAWKGSALQHFPVNLEKRKNKQQGKHAGVFIEFNFTLRSEQQAYQSSYNLHSSKMTSDQSTGWLKAKFKKKTKTHTFFWLVSGLKCMCHISGTPHWFGCYQNPYIECTVQMKSLPVLYM